MLHKHHLWTCLVLQTGRHYPGTERESVKLLVMRSIVAEFLNSHTLRLCLFVKVREIPRIL